MDLKAIFNSFNNIKIGVIGDVMLDTYWWGNVDRISPEGPVPIVAITNKEYRIGGAGNVAWNLSELGCKATILSVVGNDDNALQLTNLLKAKNIETNYLLKVNYKPTTNKIRIIGRSQQMMRLDDENVDDILLEDEIIFWDLIVQYFENEKPNVIILEDYNKGVLTTTIIKKIIDYCNLNKIITTVDPKLKNFLEYKNCTIFKPNLKEIKQALNIIDNIEININSFKELHSKLFEHLQHQYSLITLSEFGIFIGNNNQANIIPAHIRNISDVSGAGDTVIAVASLVFATTNNITLATQIANIAGGIVCETVGTTAISKSIFLNEVLKLESEF